MSLGAMCPDRVMLPAQEAGAHLNMCWESFAQCSIRGCLREQYVLTGSCCLPKRQRHTSRCAGSALPGAARTGPTYL